MTKSAAGLLYNGQVVATSGPQDMYTQAAQSQGYLFINKLLTTSTKSQLTSSCGNKYYVSHYPSQQTLNLDPGSP